jgi:hypothetical protein
MLAMDPDANPHPEKLDLERQCTRYGAPHHAEFARQRTQSIGGNASAAVSTPFLKDEHADLQQILLYNLDGRELPD